MATRNQGKRTQKVCVTGVCGSVGALLAEELIRDGYTVIGVDLPGGEFPAGVEVRELDLTREGAAAAAVARASAVIHTAASVDIGRAFAQLAPINLDAVKSLYHAALAEGVSRFVHFSSGSIYQPGAQFHTESDALYAANDYGWTKLLADEFLLSQAGLHVTIIRPAMIFGPRGKVLFAALASMAELVRWTLPAVPRFVGGPRTNMVHSLDVARAAAFLLQHDHTHGEVYNVCSGDALTFGDHFNTAFEVAGVPQLPISVPFPQGALRWLGPLLKQRPIFAGLNRVLRLLWEHQRERHDVLPELDLWLDPEALDFATGDTLFDGSKLAETGFELRFPNFRVAWEDTIGWYRRAGWLSRIEANTDGRDAQRAA